MLVGHIDMAQEKDLYRKSDILRHSLMPIIMQKEQAQAIWIEEPAKVYQSSSTAHVMALLQRWNGMVSYFLYEATGVAPKLIGAAQARKAVGISLSGRQKKKETKALIAEHIKRNVAEFPDVWQYKKTGTLKDFCYDICDAYVVAKAGQLHGLHSASQQLPGNP